MSEPTIDELLDSYRTLDPKDAYVVHRLGSEIDRLRAELATTRENYDTLEADSMERARLLRVVHNQLKIAVEALAEIECRDPRIGPGVAADALARIRKMGGE